MQPAVHGRCENTRIPDSNITVHCGTAQKVSFIHRCPVSWSGKSTAVIIVSCVATRWMFCTVISVLARRVASCVEGRQILCTGFSFLYKQDLGFLYGWKTNVLQKPLIPCANGSALRHSQVKVNSHIQWRVPATSLPCSDSAVSFGKVRVLAGKIRTYIPVV